MSINNKNEKVFLTGWLSATAATRIRSLLEGVGAEISTEGNVMTIKLVDEPQDPVDVVIDAMVDASLVDDANRETMGELDSGSETEYEESDDDVATAMPSFPKNKSLDDSDDFLDSQDCMF